MIVGQKLNVKLILTAYLQGEDTSWENTRQQCF